MDNKKYEQLINLVINENEEQARELFHEIVVEKSREIFESIMSEEEMGGQVGDLLDEIDAEESGMMEDEDDDFSFTGDEEVEMSDDDFADSAEDEEVEDAVIRIEDKLDQLMAEFEEIMAGDHASDEEFGNDEDFDSDMGDEEDFDSDMGDEEDFDSDMGDEDEESLAEAIQLKKVSVTHGDNGANTKSPNTNNSGSAGMDSKPVKFSGSSETVPTGPKGPSNAYSKGETQVKGAGSFKNSPGKDNFKDKGESAPKPKHGDNGANTKSPVAESRRPLRRR